MKSTLSAAIKQTKPFESDYHKALVTLKYAANRINAWQNNFFAPFGITPHQFNILRILRGAKHNSLTINDIKSRMIDDNSDVSRILDRMQKLELVERKTKATDKRSVQVIISSIGLELLERLDTKMHVTFDTIFEEITPDQARQLSKILDRVIENITD